MPRSRTCFLAVFGIWCLFSCGCPDTEPTDPNGDMPSTMAGELAPVATSTERPPVPSEFGIRFQQRSDHRVDFTYRNDEESGLFSIVESMGGGAALADFDADSRLDLFLTGGGRFVPPDVLGNPPGLYRQESSWRFSDVTAAGRVDREGCYSHGVAVGDADNDGFADFVVTGYGGLQFFRNQGDGTFLETALECGIADPSWSTSAAWGDLNGDSSPDLYVAHYVNWSYENDPVCPGPAPHPRDVCPPRRFDGLPDALYFSNSDGTFQDASRLVGLRSDGKGIGVIIGDFDLDRDLDIYVANDTVSNFLYRNQQDQLEEIGLVSATALSDGGTADGSMGTDLGDFNLDGLPDLWVANYQQESFALYRNLGDCLFRHVSRITGVSAVGGMYVGWGTLFLDVDNDGDEDLFGSNGHVVHFPTESTVAQLPLLLENLGGTRLTNVATAAGDYMASPHRGRGVASGDVDADGDVDLAVSHVNEPAALLENVTDVDHDWIAMRLIGTRSCRDAVGAIVTVHLTDGRDLVRQRKSGGSYASSPAPDLHFGLGLGVDVDSVTIDWPSGQRDEHRDLALREHHVLVESTQ